MGEAVPSYLSGGTGKGTIWLRVGESENAPNGPIETRMEYLVGTGGDSFTFEMSEKGSQIHSPWFPKSVARS